jgi:organic radical activating enzyme
MELVEWECVLECNYRCPYCTNGHNGVLETPIRYEKDKNKVYDFIRMLKEKYPDVELFLFGGEPFVHPFIEDIIHWLNKVGMDFVVQTNAALPKRIAKIDEPMKVQVSVHSTQIKDWEEYLDGLGLILDKLHRIDVMYDGERSLQMYRDIVKRYGNLPYLYLAPLADFNIEEDIVNSHLFRYNELKNSPYSQVYRFEVGARSFKWEEQMKGVWSPKGKPCMYAGRYILYDPQLRSYTCNYRDNNEICPNDHCFLM